MDGGFVFKTYKRKVYLIIQVIVDSWTVGDGIGPGHPTHGFWSDNGGEFLNSQMINFAAACDIWEFRFQ